LESDPQFFVPSFPDSKLWDSLRTLLNRYLKFKAIALSVPFEIAMFLLVIFNSGTFDH
jgi:hypothetical protein